jgi:hypothetical protein
MQYKTQFRSAMGEWSVLAYDHVPVMVFHYSYFPPVTVPSLPDSPLRAMNGALVCMVLRKPPNSPPAFTHLTTLWDVHLALDKYVPRSIPLGFSESFVHDALDGAGCVRFERLKCGERPRSFWMPKLRELVVAGSPEEVAAVVSKYGDPQSSWTFIGAAPGGSEECAPGPPQPPLQRKWGE